MQCHLDPRTGRPCGGHLCNSAQIPGWPPQRAWTWDFRPAEGVSRIDGLTTRRGLVDGNDIYGGVDPRAVPNYTVGAAARYLRMPAATLRAWVGEGNELR